MEKFEIVTFMKTARLYKADLEELQSILMDDAGLGLKEFTISLETDYKTRDWNSVDSLIQSGVNTKNYKCTIRGYSEHILVEGISICLYSHNAFYRVYSDDEGWFLKANKRLADYFGKRRLWYWPFKSEFGRICIAILTMLLVLTGMFAVVNAHETGATMHYVLGVACFLTSLLCWVVSFANSLFPDSRIFTFENKKMDLQKASVIITFITLLVTIAGVVLTLLFK
jgi:hypothetical protein